MVDFDLAATMHDTFLLAARLAGPPLLAALVAGIAVSMLQAVTQINEQTAVFLPKAAALVAALCRASLRQDRSRPFWPR